MKINVELDSERGHRRRLADSGYRWDTSLESLQLRLSPEKKQNKKQLSSCLEEKKLNEILNFKLNLKLRTIQVLLDLDRERH